MDDDIPLPFDLPAVARKKMSAAFDGGRITSDGRAQRSNLVPVQPNREIQGSQQTLRWRETDSNSRSPVRQRTVFETPPACVRRPWPHKSAISDAIAANILFAPFL
jgi:hypothetical protein